MTLPARLRLFILCLLCAATALSLSTAPIAPAAGPKAGAAKKKKSKKRRGTKRDRDGDGIPNSRDRDVDGDGIPNSRDRDVDGDRIPNWRDRDIDGDGRRNPRDRDMDGDRLPNARDRDMDGDGRLNIHDTDPDADGKPGIAPGVLPPLPPPVKQPRDFFGVVNDRETIDQRAAMAATGVGTVRVTWSWSNVELSRGSYNFYWPDKLVGAMAEHGLTVFPVLSDPPSFRSSAPSEGAARGVYPPASNADFAAFAAATARRYGPGGSFWQEHPSLPARPIRAWQVWNEPNLPVYWPVGPSPDQYVEMLRSVGAAIKGADPDAEIVTAGLPDSRLGMPLEDYIRGMYRAGGKEAFDTLAIHAYATTAEGVSETLFGVREILDRHGDRDAGLRMTEFGWATGGGDSPFLVNEQAQGTLIRQTLARAAGESDRLRLRGVAYYNFRDIPVSAYSRDFWGLHTGLIDVGGRPKPAFQAFGDAVRSLTGE